jgi:putative hydrolase of the HAD superfamily
MIKAIIFDCWGTLFFREELYSTKAIAGILGMEYTDEFRKRFQMAVDTNMNDYRTNAVKLALEFRKKPEENLISEIIKKLDVPKEKIFPFPETIKVLKELKQMYKLGLLTNAQFQTFSKLNEKYSINSLFNAVVCSFESKRIKPDKAMFSLILDKLNENRDTALMVGNDFKQDVRGAEHFGMMAVLVDRDGRYPEYEKRIISLVELPRFLV